MTLAIAQRLQLFTPVHRQHAVRREAEATDVSRRLAERVRRVPEAALPATPMALRREPRPAVISQPPSIEEFATRSLSDWRTRQHSASPPMAAPSVNIDQLASQVLKQIDRRVVARRERMGQV
jgi:hypothetical protein